jgi:DNA processing protein
MSSALLLSLAIVRLPGLRPNERLVLDDLVDSEQFFRALDAQTLGQVLGRKVRTDQLRPDVALAQAARDLDYCERRGVRVVSFWDELYPAALREIYDPPLLIFVRGQIPRGERPMLAVVGTREPGADAVAAAEELARELVCAGFPVVSGLARGIDAAAHRGALRGCLEAGASVTGAVLGCGIDGVSPASNRGLAAEILAKDGFIASEYPPGVPAAKYHFPARNRIISGLSRGVVVVQAPAKSGALITADYALDQGRDLFVHARGVTGTLGAGTSELAADGARIISGADDIFDEWGVPRDERAAPAPRALGRTRADRVTSGVLVGTRLAEMVGGSLGLEEYASNEQ